MEKGTKSKKWFLVRVYTFLRKNPSLPNIVPVWVFWSCLFFQVVESYLWSLNWYLCSAKSKKVMCWKVIVQESLGDHKKAKSCFIVGLFAITVWGNGLKPRNVLCVCLYVYLHMFFKTTSFVKSFLGIQVLISLWIMWFAINVRLWQ